MLPMNKSVSAICRLCSSRLYGSAYRRQAVRSWRQVQDEDGDEQVHPDVASSKRSNFTERVPQMVFNLNEQKKKARKKLFGSFDIDSVATNILGEKQDEEVKKEKITFQFLDEGSIKFGPVVATAKSRDSRLKHQQIFLEGTRLITDAAMAGVLIKFVYFTKMEILNEIPTQMLNAKYYKVTARHMRVWSDCVTPPGIVAIAEMPSSKNVAASQEGLTDVILVLDQIRDPGNMGSLIRSAAAAGCNLVVTTKGCVDVWEPKVLRSGAGGHFHTQIVNSIAWPLILNYIGESPSVYLADHLSQVMEMPLDVEKLGALLQEDGSNETFFKKTNDGDDSEQVDPSYSPEAKNWSQYKSLPLPARVYTDCMFGRNSVLVIGGETEGLSPSAHKLAYDCSGSRIFIPMSCGINSINAAMAGSIILFEMRRQILKEA